MATIRPQYRWPMLPSERATKYRVAVTGPALTGMCESVNTLILARLSEAHLCCTWDASSTEIVANDPSGLSVTHRLTWESHPRAEYLWVGLHYQAHGDVSGSGPYVDLSLYVQGGALIDGSGGDAACRFDKNAGLEIGRRLQGAGFAASYTFPVWRACTPWTIIDSPASYPSDPRLLNIGSDAGSTLELIIEAEDVRIHSVDIVEVFRESQDQ